ncbi:MAG: hypothetical protein Q8L98_06175 [Chlamydiales bacterium]|nr:hypothetical protein [Chlamydiales bacterium]
MANSIVTDVELFIASIQRHRDCSTHFQCQERGYVFFESLITWITTNEEDDEYEPAITDIFSLLETLHKKGAFSNQTFYELSEKAIKIIESSPNTISSELQVFLHSQRLD